MCIFDEYEKSIKYGFWYRSLMLIYFKTNIPYEYIYSDIVLEEDYFDYKLYPTMYDLIYKGYPLEFFDGFDDYVILNKDVIFRNNLEVSNNINIFDKNELVSNDFLDDFLIY